MAKWLKTVIAVLLLPVCWGGAKALYRVVQSSSQTDVVWVALLAGAACWCVVFWLMPRPMWLYVFGHELTHVLWVWAFGGRVRRFQSTAKGGRVVVTKDNFLITLSPYFCPIYAMGIALGFGTGNWIWGWQSLAMWVHLLVGAAYAFHVTLTWEALAHRQPDLAQQGYFFSFVVIGLGNLMVLLIGLAWLTGEVGPVAALGWCWGETDKVLRDFIRWMS